jgi:AraC-like DNA-binding protein
MIENFVTTVFLSMTFGVAMVCIGLVIRGCIADAKWPPHAIALAYFFVIMATEASENLNQSLPDQLRLSWLQGTTLFLVPSLGACIWLYIRSLTSQEPALARRDLWHLVPIAICIVGALPFQLLSKHQQTSIVSPNGTIPDPANFLAVIGMLVAWIAWIAILVLYGGASITRLIKHRRAIRDLYSKVDGHSLLWLHSLIMIVVAFTVAVIAASILPATGSPDPFSRDVVAVFYFCIVIVVGMFGVLQKNTIPSWNELVALGHTDRRYARSALQSADMTRIARKLDVAMRGARLWKNPNLSLIDIANDTGVSQNNISQTLNEHLGVNFYDYVNGWRIQAACDALRDKELSVLAIAEDDGFNAKSTFNAAFKKVTGKTPRQYRTTATAPLAIPVK